MMSALVGTVRVEVHPTRAAMGESAATDVAAELRRRLDRQERVRIVFAAAPSQSEMLAGLVAATGIDWGRVSAFHMDEYLGLPPEAPQRFARWLDRELFDRVPFGSVHRMDPDREPVHEVRRYAAVLAEAPIDVVCLGIGQNGHLAFNDPPVADLSDPVGVKVVELDDDCRRQQVEDGCFPRLADVPREAITLTVPRLLAADRLFCVVPGSAKRNAVRAALSAPVSARHPATALRTHPDVTLYLDRHSAPGSLVTTMSDRT